VGAEIELREITSDTLRDIFDLKVAPEQLAYVAPNDRSIAEAHFEPNAWFRGIYAGDVAVGFVSLWRQPPEFWVWRFMIDATQQGKGYGRDAMKLIVEEARKDGVDEIKLSFHPGDDSPHAFYERLGFEETGEVEGDEHVMRLALG
jgi:diamine N-acetyltransferase